MLKLKIKPYMDFNWDLDKYGRKLFTARDIQIGAYKKNRYTIYKTFYFMDSPVTLNETVKLALLFNALLYSQYKITTRFEYTQFMNFIWEKKEPICKLIEIGMDIKNKEGYPLVLNKVCYKDRPITKAEYDKFSEVFDYLLHF